MSHIDCNWTTTFMRQYFAGELSVILQDYMYEHLLECKQCYEKYKNRATELGLSFNLRDKALEFAIEHAHKKKICYTKKMLIKLGFEKDLEAMSNKWTRAAERVDIEQLMNLQAFSDFSQEQMTIKSDNWDEDLDAVYQYTKWFATKLCKDIDHLNKCYLIGEEPKEEEDINEKS